MAIAVNFVNMCTLLVVNWVPLLVNSNAMQNAISVDKVLSEFIYIDGMGDSFSRKKIYEEIQKYKCQLG